MARKGEATAARPSNSTNRARSGSPCPCRGREYRAYVDAAREAIKDNQRQSESGDRFWELSGGVLYCDECGCRMTVHATLDSRNGRRYCYYRCPKRGSHGVHKVCINGKHYRAAEAAVWTEVLQERRSCLRFSAEGHVSDKELDEALARLEETRMTAEAADT